MQQLQKVNENDIDDDDDEEDEKGKWPFFFLSYPSLILIYHNYSLSLLFFYDDFICHSFLFLNLIYQSTFFNVLKVKKKIKEIFIIIIFSFEI